MILLKRKRGRGKTTMKDREEKIYNRIIKLKKGTKEQIYLAIKCEKILANESSKYSLKEKLNKIERIIEPKRYRESGYISSLYLDKEKNSKRTKKR